MTGHGCTSFGCLLEQATKCCNLAPSILGIIFAALALSYKNMHYFICPEKESAR
jgi:hypothetical protein